MANEPAPLELLVQIFGIGADQRRSSRSFEPDPPCDRPPAGRQPDQAAEIQLSLNRPANHRSNPNANLVRELLELFSLGEGHYSERDVREACSIRRANYELASWVIHQLLMRSTITSRGQTVIPAAIRERFGLGPAQRLEWLVEADGSIRVIPVAVSPIQAFRGQGKQGGSSQRLLADRKTDASLEA